jgi:hypothetical protein
MTSTTLVSVVLGVAIAALLVVRQPRAQPVSANMRLPLIIGIIGLIEITNYLQKVHGHVGAIAITALIGSFILAAVLGAARAATVHLWIQDGQPWRKGTWLTGTLWVVSLAAHFGLDYLIDPHSPNGGIAGASLLLYLALTYTMQRVIMQARARRIPVTGHSAPSLTRATARPWPGP